MSIPYFIKSFHYNLNIYIDQLIITQNNLDNYNPNIKRILIKYHRDMLQKEADILLEFILKHYDYQQLFNIVFGVINCLKEHN
jgi:hypothetical protein